MITCILLELIFVQNSITIPHIAVIQFMCVIKWPQSHTDGSCVNKNVRGNKGFYSIILSIIPHFVSNVSAIIIFLEIIPKYVVLGGTGMNSTY